jgi:hypothetical protein
MAKGRIPQAILEDSRFEVRQDLISMERRCATAQPRGLLGDPGIPGPATDRQAGEAFGHDFAVSRPPVPALLTEILDARQRGCYNARTGHRLAPFLRTSGGLEALAVVVVSPNTPTV